MTDPRPPKPETLRKWGIDEAYWLAIAARQGNVCPICEREPKDGKFCIDHEHIPMKRWRKLPKEERKKYIRGLTCRFCNKWNLNFVTTIDRTRRVLAYLEAYALRSEPPF